MKIMKTVFLVILELSLAVAALYLFWLSGLGTVVDVQFVAFLIAYISWQCLRFRKHPTIRIISIILTLLMAGFYVYHYETQLKSRLVEGLVAEGVCMPSIRFPELSCP